MMDEYSESLRMLKETSHGKGLMNTIIGFGDGWGDLLLVEHIRLEPRYRGYGIGLLAVKMFRDHIGEASEGWNQEGVMIVDASGLNSDLEPEYSRRELQIRMFRHWQLIGLKPIVSEFERKRGKQCNFVGNWQTIYGFPWDMATLVPHLFTANCDTANVRPTTPKRRSSLEEIYALVNSAQKRARMHRTFGED